MPCYDGRPAQTETEERISKAVTILRNLLLELGRPIPELVDSQYRNGYPNDRRIEPMLCELLGSLSSEETAKINASGQYWVKDLNAWWMEHQIQDAVLEGKESPFPVKQQEMVVTAINKLTRTEAALLGLTDLWDTTNNFIPEQKD
jgi:hypothetical protein